MPITRSTSGRTQADPTRITEPPTQPPARRVAPMEAESSRGTPTIGTEQGTSAVIASSRIGGNNDAPSITQCANREEAGNRIESSTVTTGTGTLITDGATGVYTDVTIQSNATHHATMTQKPSSSRKETAEEQTSRPVGHRPVEERTPSHTTGGIRTLKNSNKKLKREMLLSQARRKLELAAARVAEIEAAAQLAQLEEQGDTDEEYSLTTNQETERRVNDWLDASQTELLAITDQPHNRPTTTQQKRVIERSVKQLNISETPVQPSATEQRAIPTTMHAIPVPHALHNPGPVPAGVDGTVAVQQPQQINLTELATAIAVAAKSGQQLIPRYNIDLPIYNGSYQEWLSFKAAYMESSGAYTETENTSRLRHSLRGRAKEVVENLLIYNPKPEEILRSLESKFGHPHAIALSELQRLRGLQRPTDDPKDLCDFSSKVTNIVTALRALNKIYYLYNPEITKMTIEKLTPAMRYRWFDFAAETQEDEADLLKLARFLQREAERCSPYAQPEQIEASSGRVQKQRRITQRTYNTDGSTEQQECPVCKLQGHNTKTCKQFVEADVNTRWDIAKKKYLCFRCLKYRTKKHTCRGKPCAIDDCKRFHHNMLHVKKEKQTEAEEKPEVVSSTWTPTKTQAYLKIIPVSISGPKGRVDTHALLDDGSTITLLDADIAKQIGLRGPIEPLHIESIANTEVEAGASRRVTLTLHGETSSHEIQARTFKNLQLSSQVITDRDLAGCKHLLDIEEKLKYKKVVPKLLIGQDNWHLLLARKVKKGKPKQPVASLTALGWVLHGAHTRTLGQRVNHIHHLTEADEKMDEELKHHFALESLMITPKRPKMDPEQRALDLLKEHTQREDGRYETALLWKNDKIEMANNYENAYSRLLSTEKKIDKDPELKHKYNEQMNALISKGYAEQAPPTTSKKTWYLPHFPVLNPMKPGKVRVVHDAAAKTKGVSLNDHLLTGPDLLQSLPGVLMRFRQHPIAVTADIAEMFMQVKIREEDRDALRYLWRGDHREKQPSEYRMTSLIFGATSSPATAIFVKNLNAEKHKDTRPAAYEAIVRNHYVDDYLQSFKDLKEAKKITQEVRAIQLEAHYDLKQWTSNSVEVLETLDVDSESQSSKDLDDGTKTERVLGLIWKPGTDELAFNLNLARLPPEVMDDKEPTKRKMLKIIMSLFDPLGFASPVTTRAKQILQETWRRGTGWDDKLEEDLIHQWQQWMEHLRALKDIRIPRCHLHYSDAMQRELHIFVDASEAAYAAVIYWRLTDPSGEVNLSLVLGKARVAPLKITSIPRLELQAAVMGSRMAAAVVEEHDEKPDQRIFWTDSRTVLTWIKTGARSYKPYVAHRVASIEENSKVTEWRWIPTKMNVADDATRDVPNRLDTEHRWFSGPEFLKQDPSTWPNKQMENSTETGEEKVHNIEVSKPVSIKNTVPDPRRFSKWERLLRATGRVLQFIKLCRRRAEAVNYKRNKKNKEKDPAWNALRKTPKEKRRAPRANLNEKRNFLPIEAETLKQAEELLIRAAQQDSFAEEIKNLNSGKEIPKDSRLRSLAVENINGMITLKTRIGAVEDAVIEKRPPILDGNHRITQLYIDYVHRQLHHSGVETTVNECRQKFWILRMRPAAKTIIKNCLPCRIRRNTPPTPATGNHPHCRLAHHHRPFTFTGVDYFGPLSVTVGRSTQKVYVALFTCLTTRAVHLELAASLSTDSAVMALRRMAARRGCPTEIWSDNGTNLHGAAKELCQATEEEALKKGINWRFIPPGAPFMGGAWERLVRSVKVALTTVLHERSPSQEVLVTLLAEAEYTVNSRPLTHVSVNPEDPEALTPNHFLLGGSARTPTPGTFEDADLIGRTHWRASQRLADLFWARWLKEYLPDLQYRREPYGRGPSIKVGDVVLIADGTLPRNVWPRGLVTGVFPGPDGIIRAVDVRTKGGTLRRPAKKLVILPTEPADLHQDMDASS